MKTRVLFRSKWMVLAGVIFLLPIFGGCQEDELPEGEARLSRIQNNPDHASLPLIGTQWKLIGFVDARRSMIKLAEPAGEDTYLLMFNDNGEISGRTSTNTAFGTYSLDDETVIEISQFNHLTKINELFDGRYFIDSMKNVFSYNRSPKGLKLHYDPGQYVLFRPLERISLSGKAQSKHRANRHELKIGHLSAGIYGLHLDHGKGTVSRQLRVE